MNNFVIGIDGGGTHTRGLDHSGTQILGPPCNVALHGVERSAQVIAGIIERLAPAPQVPLSIVAGIAGAAGEGLVVGLTSKLMALLGPRNVRLSVTTDAELALDAAHGPGRAGMILIAGTGSIAYSRTAEGDLARSGGWGPALGDAGGGFKIGLAGLGAIADAMDGGPETALKAIGRERWSIEDAGTLRDLVYQQQRSPAGFAPSVLDAFEAADPVATAIVTNQVAALATRVAWLAARADCGDRRLVIFGGLTARDSFTQALDAALASVLPGWTTERPSLSPVEAAVQRAASM